MPTIFASIDSSGARAGAAQYDAATKKMVGSSKEAAAAVDTVARRSTAAANALGKLKTIAASTFGVIAAVQGIRNSIRLLADFEQTMLTVGNVSGATAKEMVKLTATARELGATTRFSAKEAGEGLLFLARAGFSADAAIISLPSTLDLAQAGMLGLGEAADFASNILSQFGLSADETVRVVDTLIITANSANTDVRQLAEGMKFAGPIAGALGRSVEETAAALGVLGDSGVQASLAGTNMRGVLLALVAPTSQAKEAFKTMKTSIDELDPTSRTLAEIFEELAESGLDAAEANAIFGRRNAAAALILADGATKVAALAEANRTLTGTARAAAEAMDSGLRGALFGLVSATQELVLSVGDAGVTGGLTTMVRVMADAVRVAAGVESAIRDAGLAAQTLGFALQVVEASALAFITVMAVRGVAALVLFTINVGTLTAALTIAEIKLRATFAVFAAHPIGAATLAVAVFIAGIWSLVEAIRAAGEITTDWSRVTADLSAQTSQFAASQAELNRSIARDDINGQALAYERMADAIDKSTIELQKLIESSASGAAFINIEDIDRLNIPDFSRETIEAQVQQQLTDSLQGALNLSLESGAELDLKPFINKATVALDIQLGPIVSGELTEEIKEIIRWTGEAEAVAQSLIRTYGITRLPATEAFEDLEGRMDTLNERAEELRILAAEELALNVDSASIEAARSALDSFVSSLQEELAIANLSDQQRAVIIAQRKVESLAIQAEISDTRTLSSEVAFLVNEIARLNAERGKPKEESQGIDPRVATLSALDAVVAGYEAETRVLAESADKRQLAAERIRLENIARGSGIESIERYVTAIGNQIRIQELLQENQNEASIAVDVSTATFLALAAISPILQANIATLFIPVEISGATLAPEVRDARQTITEMFAAIDFEQQQVGASNADRQLAIELLKLEGLARRGLVVDIEALTAKYAEEVDALVREERIRDLGDALGSAIGQGVEQGLFEIKRLEDALKNLAQLVARTLFNQLVTQQIVGAVTSGVQGALGGGSSSVDIPAQVPGGGLDLPVRQNELGNAFSNGSIVPFGSGGIPDLTTLFPLASGKIGVMNERLGAGEPEVIAPLARGPGGKLGIEIVGGGGGGKTVSNTFNMTFKISGADDARGVKKSARQIAGKLRREMERLG